MVALLALTGALFAAEPHQLTWDVTVKGQPLGKREATIKYAEGDLGMRRIIESWTELDGQVGPIRVRYRQRLTAHAVSREPASFQSVIDENGALREVQGRWTASGWMVTVTGDGRSRTVEMPLDRIDLSTADLVDPATSFVLAHYETARILSAETGEVAAGPITELGISELTIAGEPVQVTGYGWDNPQGRSTFYYSPDGFLVRYETQILGIPMVAVLNAPPPGGVDDFPVGISPPAVEELPL
ncbi:MAG: hypothetical protein ACI8PZ_006862 [Myxococcota bacterium]|jgi:hypothetical protein